MGVRSRSRAGASSRYVQTVTTTAAGIPSASIPSSAMCAEGYCDGPGIVRFTRDGTTPTSTTGFAAYADDIIVLNSRDEIDQFKAYASTSSTIQWEFFTDVSG